MFWFIFEMRVSISVGLCRFCALMPSFAQLCRLIATPGFCDPYLKSGSMFDPKPLYMLEFLFISSPQNP